MSETQQPDRAEKKLQNEAKRHPALIWTSLAPGDVVSLRVLESEEFVGTVESKTSDGLIIWVRDDLNERKLFHFRECNSVRVLTDSADKIGQHFDRPTFT